MKRVILLAVVLSVGCAVAGWRGRFDELFAASVAEAEWTPAALGPIAWYKGENNAIDSAGEAEGTWTGTETYTDGVTGAAMWFFSGAYVEAVFSITNRPISFSAWVNFGEDSLFSEFLRVRAADNSFSVTVGSTTTTKNSITSRMAVSNIVQATSRGSVIKTNGWHHVSVIVSTGATVADVYVDGSLGTESLGETPLAAKLGRVQMGALRSLSSIGLDDVLIFDRALTPLEISTLYNESINKNGEAW